MSANHSLYDLLDAQRIAQDSEEMKEIQEHRAAIETIIDDAFPNTEKTIRYGGSKAKGTMIQESYDLDIIIYVHNGEDGLGASLKDIYQNIAEALEVDYYVERKNCALRLSARSGDNEAEDLHIDVVPGRYVDDTKSDAYLHQNEGDKERLKTNLQTHIDHIRNCESLDVLKLLKLMRVRHDLEVKQFALDLLGVDLLKDKTNLSLDDQLTNVLDAMRNSETPLSIEDPANPTGNDLSDLLAGYVWDELRQTASTMLDDADANGWGASYGEADVFDSTPAVVVTEAIDSVDVPTQPWTY